MANGTKRILDAILNHLFSILVPTPMISERRIDFGTHQRKDLEPLGYRRGWRSYGKQPRQRQCKKTRFAPQKDRAPRSRQSEHDQKSEKVTPRVNEGEKSEERRELAKARMEDRG